MDNGFDTVVEDQSITVSMIELFEEPLSLFFLGLATFLTKFNLPHVSLSKVAVYRSVFSIVITFFLIILPNYNHHEINLQRKRSKRRTVGKAKRQVA